ncbi:bZIP transcription factor JlbA/IDI-4 [Aspergillus glaucus CBS 516.65]|uniref:Uncharacterized protein n=1 Tax=Aspergillus glaucus CBS 516.65 TaxID=1160497 RepID=A0A1L9V9M7_ASPGL|nr:hypothetical protein ASPGLDRAFT_856490 [Aspergillus glaucus CBS 516.65]OJJ80593.1 hypothetical protein ASPGLDRAFT_856490 [Aspergillus glaucus CBS 516.65]
MVRYPKVCSQYILYWCSSSNVFRLPTSADSSASTQHIDSFLQFNRLNVLQAKALPCRETRKQYPRFEKVKQERDELRIRVSKLEGETEALRGLVWK